MAVLFVPIDTRSYFLPIITLASSAYAEREPEGYDSSTYKRLNEAYTVLALCNNPIQNNYGNNV